MKVAFAIGLLACSMTLNGPQGQAPPDVPTPVPVSLEVAGQVPRPVKLDADALSRLPHRSARVRERDGAEVEYEGVPLFEILKNSGVSFGEELRGPALADYLVVEASDGYRVVFALPELDPASSDHVVLLADRRDGKSLDRKQGPLRVIATGDKRPSRWVRQVVSLKVGRG